MVGSCESRFLSFYREMRGVGDGNELFSMENMADGVIQAFFDSFFCIQEILYVIFFYLSIGSMIFIDAIVA